MLLFKQYLFSISNHFSLILSPFPVKNYLFEFALHIAQIIQLFFLNLVLQLQSFVLLLNFLLINQLLVFILQLLIFPYQLIQILLFAYKAYRLLFGLMQHFIQLEMPLICNLFGTLNHMLGQTASLRNGEGIRAPRLTYYQLVQWEQLLLIKSHGSVEDTGYFARHHLQIEIVGSNDTHRLFLSQLLYYGFCKSTTQIGVRTTTQLIYKE